jgi:outer membrane protein assembly factor BamB
VGNSVYVGTWDGRFYSLNAATGRPRWVFDIAAANPTAFGQIVSSAAVEPFHDTRAGKSREVVVFGGGSILWALDAATGKLLASIDFDPRSAKLRTKQLNGANPPVVEIESSPAVADVRVGSRLQKRIFVGMDVHNDPGVGRTGVVALRLTSTKRGTWAFRPIWKSDPETDRTYHGRRGLTQGSGKGEGCGDVWSSPAVDATKNLVVYGVANCDDPPAAKARHENWSESITAVRADTGKFRWRYAPAAHEGSTSADTAAAYSDDDFGASVNIYRDGNGRLVAGDGSKNSTYYARSARTGKRVWQTKSGTPGNLQQDFAVGGFIGSAGVATSGGRATHLVGATAIPLPTTSTGDLVGATEDVHSFNPATGAVQWTAHLTAPTYASTSIVNDLALVPLTTGSSLVALDLDSGLPLWTGALLGPPSSTAVVSGSSVYVGTGTNETDLQYKAMGLAVPATTQRTVGQSPLSPASGVQAFQLATDLAKK